MPGMLGFAGLIFCYRFGDQMVSSLLGPFLSDYGLTKETIAVMKGTVGSATSLIGALIGGWLAFSAGRRTAVLVSGVAQAACFSLVHRCRIRRRRHVNLLWAATIVEGVIGTMATVALFTLMMDASDPEHAGTDYTLFASIVVLVGSIGNFCWRRDCGRVRLRADVHRRHRSLAAVCSAALDRVRRARAAIASRCSANASGD